jgi:hypothetical protein
VVTLAPAVAGCITAIPGMGAPATAPAFAAAARLGDADVELDPALESLIVSAEQAASAMVPTKVRRDFRLDDAEAALNMNSPASVRAVGVLQL